MTSKKLHLRRTRNVFLQSAFVRTSACCSLVHTCKILTSPVRINLRMKWSFTSMCLLLDSLLRVSAIAFAPLLSPKISTRMPLSSGWRNSKTALVNSASLDASHKATYYTSHVAVVTHFWVLLFQPMAVSPNITATPDTDLRSLDAAA